MASVYVSYAVRRNLPRAFSRSGNRFGARNARKQEKAGFQVANRLPLGVQPAARICKFQKTSAPVAEPATGAFASSLRWDENLAPVRARDENRPEPGRIKHQSG